MSTKLWMLIIMLLSICEGMSATYWIVKNYTPFEITVKYHVGFFGKEETHKISPNGEYRYTSKSNIKAIEILQIKTLADEYFQDGKSVILKDSFKIPIPEGITWGITAEVDFEKAATKPALSQAPKKVRFFLVRQHFKLHKGGVIGASAWFDPVTGAVHQ